MNSFESPSFESPSFESPIKSIEKEPLTYEEKGGIYPRDFPVTYLPKHISDEQGNPVYILTYGNFLYRGDENRALPLEYLNDIKWFGLDLKNVLEYGYPSQYKLNTNLKLLAIDEINVEHRFFTGLREDMKHKFEIFIRTNNNGIRERVSVPQNDYDLCEYICRLGYDGYAMKEMKSDSHFYDDVNDMFHAEVALKNGNEKLSEPVHINVDNLKDKDGRNLEFLGKEANIKNIEERIEEYKEQQRKMEEDARKAKEKRKKARQEMGNKRVRDPPLFHNLMIIDDEDNEPFIIQGKPTIFNFESPPKKQYIDPNTSPSSPLPFSYSSPYSSPFPSPFPSSSIRTGGKTKKRNRKTKKNKKKQTKKKNKKSKRKSNKK
jgi:hypothetical protein